MDLATMGSRFSPWSTPVPGVWSAWADRYDGTPLGPVPLLSMSFSQKLSDYGDGSATIAISDAPIEQTDLLRMWSWRLWLFYEGQTMWCGMPSSLVDNGTNVLSLGFTEIHGYLKRRALDTGPANNVWPWVISQMEQTEIARQLAAPVADVGVHLVIDPGPGFARDRSYDYLEGPYRADLLTNLSQVGDADTNTTQGPEFRMEYHGTQAALHIAYPRVGGDSGLALTVPGDAISPELTWDAEKLRTRTFAVGDAPEVADGTTPAKPVVMVDRPQPLMPRLDYIDDWTSVTLVSTLTERANTNAGLYRAPVLEVKGSTIVTDPPLGDYQLGDDVVVQVRDPMEIQGLRATGRLVERQVDCVTGKVDWTVTMTSPPTTSRANITGQINEVTAAQAALHRRRLTPL